MWVLRQGPRVLSYNFLPHIAVCKFKEKMSRFPGSALHTRVHRRPVALQVRTISSLKATSLKTSLESVRRSPWQLVLGLDWLGSKVHK